MKKRLTITTLTLASFSAFASPAQQSANIIKAVANLVATDPNLQMYSLRKVEMRLNSAKAELMSREGNCLAIPYLVYVNALGEMTVSVNHAAEARCN